MRVKYNWDRQYPKPSYWDTRTPLHKGMPKFFLLYQDLNDKKLRVFLGGLRGRVLDAGCGTGRFIAYADVGVDFSRGMLERVESHNKDRGFVRASILHLPFKDRAFSASFTVDVLLHIPAERRRDAINELRRVSNCSYNFLAEHRTIIPYVVEPLRSFPAKTFWLIIPYLAVFLAFPIDRLRRLRIDAPSQVLRKLGA